MEYIKYLEELIPEKDSLKLVKSEAEKFYKTHSLDECVRMGHELYQSNNFQIQEVGVFLLGYAAHENSVALSFLKNTVSQHDSWKIQEILAMAFDNSRMVSQRLRQCTTGCIRRIKSMDEPPVFQRQSTGGH